MGVDFFIKINGAKVKWKNTQVLRFYGFIRRQRITCRRKALSSEQVATFYESVDGVKVDNLVLIFSEFFSV